MIKQIFRMKVIDIIEGKKRSNVHNGVIEENTKIMKQKETFLLMKKTILKYKNTWIHVEKENHTFR